ncbi:MAG: tetratricopeptide repeat protein [Flavobacterium sp.]|uniref:tetratricopeptide repeat protein n=1 Tax=Flavobacterium sp. TaxID=239 RepID=UPI00121732BD|nr:tetratricopeptide repeat protein [Flavobacterium sp.]RZJ67836.1 MAG: tetratricopeptide repeat protein [Flavobacterium sp.]
MRKPVIFVFFAIVLLIAQNLHAQKEGKPRIDSLLTRLPKMANDSSKVKLLADLSFSYYNLDTNKGIKYGLDAVEISKKIGWQKGLGRAYNSIGVNYRENGEFPKALEYFGNALKISEKINDYEALGFNAEHTGHIYMMQGDFEKANDYYEKSIAFHKKYGGKVGIAWGMMNLGNVCFSRNDKTNAMAYYQKALKLQTEIKSRRATSITAHNIATLYYFDKKYYEAINYLQLALAVSKEIGDIRMESSTYQSLSTCYIDIAKSGETPKGDLPKNKTALIRLAIDQFETALKLSQEVGSLQDCMSLSEDLSDAYAEYGDDKKALQFHRQFATLKDSLSNEEKIKEFTRKEMAFAYSREQDSLKIQQQKKDYRASLRLERQKNLSILAVSGIAFSIMIVGFLIYQNRMRKRRNQKLTVVNNELNEANRVKNLFFGIINHDLRSPVSNIIKFIRLRDDNIQALDSATTKRLSEQTLTAAESLLVSMEDLLLWSKGQMRQFSPHPKQIQVSTLFDYLASNYDSDKNIRFHFENPESLSVFTDEHYLKTIMRNLTSNAIQAISGKSDGEIMWKARSENGKKIISITDNGLGSKTEVFKALYDETEVTGIKNGLGLHLIRDFAKAVNLKINVLTQESGGTTIELIMTD